MKRVKVLIPFHMIATNTNHNPGDVIEVSEEQLAKIRTVNVNMVDVLADVDDGISAESEKPKKRRSKKQ